MKTKKTKATVVFSMAMFAVLYISLIPVSGFMGVAGQQYRWMFGSYEVSLSQFAGVVTVIQIAICVTLVMTHRRLGVILSMLLLSMGALGAAFSIVRTKQMFAMPGIVMSVGAIFIILLLNRQMRWIAQKEQKIRQQAVTDPLTGLANRRGVLDFINQMLEKKKPFYLLFLDLDHFKEINDALGHKAGDVILQTISSKWRQLDNPGGLLGRNGGDEFLLILPDDGQVDVCRFMQECVDATAEGAYIEEIHNVCYATVSIGAAHFPSNADNCEELLRFADIAMYEAKEKGSNRYCLFKEQMGERARRKHELEGYVRNALEKDLFTLVFQPQFSLIDKKCRGYEALLRLMDEDGKQLDTTEFISVAEETGLIMELDLYVLEKALGMLCDVVKHEDNDQLITVNISSRQLVAMDFVTQLKKILEKTGFPPNRLEIEMTEYSYVKSVSRAITVMRELSELGIRIALDDFGTGHTSLSYLTMMPVNTIKIDKFFVDALGKDDRMDDFVHAVITMGHILDCEIVAEGIETERQMELLRSYHCDYLQGFLWGEPTTFEKLWGDM